MVMTGKGCKNEIAGFFFCLSQFTNELRAAAAAKASGAREETERQCEEETAR